jgi:tRNA pseudouridine55 synthase
MIQSPSRKHFHGIVVIDKPAGMTSHDVVNKMRGIFATKRVGHTGTLDPEATGVLVLCLGNGTRLAEYLSAAQKQYTAEITFGVETDTLDIWGKVTAEPDVSSLTEADLVRALPAFRGTISQVPPMVSALRHEGKHLYELARKGVSVVREARPIEILRLELNRFTPGARPTCELEITCSTGTYIRSIAGDLGSALGVGGAMSALRRNSVGSGDKAYTLSQAHTLEELSERRREAPQTLAEAILPLASAVYDWPRVTVTEDQEHRIRNGQALATEEITLAAVPTDNGPVAVLNGAGELVAIARLADANTVQPVKVMALDLPLLARNERSGEGRGEVGVSSHSSE